MVMTKNEARTAYGLAPAACRYAKRGEPCECRRCREAAQAAHVVHPECAGYTRGRKGDPPEHPDDEDHMRGWHAGAKRWKAAARYSSRGYHIP